MPPKIRVAAGIVLAAAVVSVAARPALAAAAPVSRIYSATQQSCLDVSTTDPAHYFLDTYGAPCNGTPAQAYAFRAAAGGPAHTYRIVSSATGKCMIKYRQAIRQGTCTGNPGWTLQRVGTAGLDYTVLVPSTVGTAYQQCVQVDPRPNGYPGPLFTLPRCSSAQSQVLRLDVTL